MRFFEKVVVITGGTSGIGLATAKEFLKEGAFLILAATNEERGANAIKELKAIKEDACVDFVKCDIGVEDDIKALMDFAGKKYDRIDVLCNNAAVDEGGDIEHTSSEVWDRTLTVNLRGPFLCTKYALPFLKKSPAGCVVNTASELGVIVCLNMIPYLASKGGLLHLSRAMALDLARYKIRVNAVCPAATDTPFLHFDLERGGRNYDEEVARIKEDYPLGRIALPEDIAPAILYFASDEACFVTGQHVVIDGGLTVK